MLKRFVSVVAALDRLPYLVVGEFEFRSHFRALRLVRGADQYSPPSTVRATRRGGASRSRLSQIDPKFARN
jgi:hypothetical protein